jgi:hypothetical protein
MNTVTKPTPASSSRLPLEVLVEDWRQGKRPVSLKINDRLQFEIKDDASFQILLDLLERLENVAAIQKGLDDFEAGRSMTLDEFKQRQCDQHGIPD